MNPVLQVKLTYRNEKNEISQNSFVRNLRASNTLTTAHIDSLISDLKHILLYYSGMSKIIDKLLVDVHYNTIIAKSNRIRELLRSVGSECNSCIVGARFSDADSETMNHIITYYIDPSAIEKTIDALKMAKNFLVDQLDGEATSENFNLPGNNLNYDNYGKYKKTKLRNIIVDASVVESFSIPSISIPSERQNYVIDFYPTELTPTDILSKLDLDITKHHYVYLGDNTLSVSKDLLKVLKKKTPYLISMISSDLSKVTLSEVADATVPPQHISQPGNEPCIGVIDTFFDKSVYFSDWVDSTDYVNQMERYLYDFDMRTHGTEVDSIIVDGPTLNPWLDDGCGHFRVRHFGVCSDRISVPTLMDKIKTIVKDNSDIHVWNLSLGGEDEVSRNFISYDAAILDEIQNERNVIFVVAGTNSVSNTDQTFRIGSPADSLNSLVVNSVRRDNHPASYTRKGKVLSFFNKPDVSYYGGDYDDLMNVVSLNHKHGVYGTSYAAPWISRKLCYLIDIMGFSREVAKALIIDSAAGWNYKKMSYKMQEVLGYGVVPIRIEDILQSKSEEIRFVLNGASFTYKTTNYGIPVPKDENGYYPFIARATLCYFPECRRAQGVDYTCRELSLQFGRVKPNGSIADINENIQDDKVGKIDERRARNDFKKWENTKVISQIEKQNRSIKSYGDLQWGFVITSKERLSTKMMSPMNFGAVITLKEINETNRLQSFIKACEIRGWIVNPIDITHQLTIYNTQQAEIKFE